MVGQSGRDKGDDCQGRTDRDPGFQRSFAAPERGLTAATTSNAAANAATAADTSAADRPALESSGAAKRYPADAGAVVTHAAGTGPRGDTEKPDCRRADYPSCRADARGRAIERQS